MLTGPARWRCSQKELAMLARSSWRGWTSRTGCRISCTRQRTALTRPDAAVTAVTGEERSHFSLSPRKSGERGLRVAAARTSAGGGAGDAAEHGAVGEAGAARIVEVEDAADHLARRIEAWNRQAVGVDDARAGVDLDAAEGEGEAAGDGIGLERRLLDDDRPVGLRHGQPDGAASVLDVGVERYVPLHRGVVGGDGLQRLGGVDAVELLAELRQGVGRHLGDSLDAVLVA